MEYNRIYNLDWIEGLKAMPDNSVDCCVTSPPYWGLRDYGVDGQLGLEKTPELFIARLTEGFNEVRRVLKPTGTLWMNLGDSYASNGTGGNGATGGRDKSTLASSMPPIGTTPLNKSVPKGMKAKDLVGIPWMAAFSLRAAGWYLRQDIIWHKPNPMPESVTDRCTKSHEYIFLLSKSGKYYYDAEAIKQVMADASFSRLSQNIEQQKGSERVPGKTNGRMKAVGQYVGGRKHKNVEIYGQKVNSFHRTRNDNGQEWSNDDGKANKRSVWTVSTKPYSEAHFATFPEDLIVDCIKAGSSEYGCCADCGTPYGRQYDKELVPGPKASYNSKVDSRDINADSQDQGSNRMKDGHKPGWINKTTTTGWQKMCDCQTDLVKPSVILDPFMGAGTTALVAAKLNRDFIGFELNQKYITIAKKRLKDQLGMFNPMRA